MVDMVDQQQLDRSVLFLSMAVSKSGAPASAAMKPGDPAAAHSL
jgi:hypothetical protein